MLRFFRRLCSVLCVGGCLLVLAPAQANIPENDFYPGNCDGPCMGSNDWCCDPNYGSGTGGGSGGGGGTCAGLYCFAVPDGPNGEPGENICQSGGGEYDSTYNQCSDGGAVHWCTLTDPCSVT